VIEKQEATAWRADGFSNGYSSLEGYGRTSHMSHQSSLAIAPPFELPTQKGEMRSLAQFLQKGPVLLAFHRGTW